MEPKVRILEQAIMLSKQSHSNILVENKINMQKC